MTVAVRASARRPSPGSRGGTGTGMTSSGRKTPVCSRMRRRTSVSVRRSRGRVEAVEPPGRLDRLERDAAHARLLQREVDDLADLAVVEALLQRHDERRRDVERVQPLERLARIVAQVGAAQLDAARSRSNESNCR